MPTGIVGFDQMARQERGLVRRQRVIDAQLEALRAEQAAAEEEVQAGIAVARELEQRLHDGQARTSQVRSAPRGAVGSRP